MSQNISTGISNVAVIGAGTMGAAIAQHFLMKNLNVLLIDLQQDSLDKGRANINSSLQEAVERRILREEKKEALLCNFTCTTDYTQLQDRDFVVEAVFENMEIKQAVFKSIEKNVANHCIIASNTSSFSITELGSVLEDQSRFLGVHYFYHAAKNKLIELIPGEQTSPENIELLTNFYYDKDKAPIVVADVYGFAVNRFFVPWLNEAVRLHEEGLGSIAFIDKVAVDVFNVGMGPFALMNATGVPIAMHAARTLEEHFGPMYAPAQGLVDQVEKQQQWDLSSSESPADNLQEVADRLLAMSLGVAAQMVSEGVTGVTETDLGARLGLRWPLGPFELMNQLGVTQIAATIKREFEKYKLPVPAIFSEIDSDQGFQVKHVQAHIIGTTGLIEFNRPDAMNALNPTVIACLSTAFDELDNNPEIEKIILFGRGKAFLAGADIKFFVDNIEAKNLQAVYDFTSFGQKVLTKIANSEKQTIAYLDGLTLGGGLELALACDHRIATKRLLAAFPETGIGIYPGLGGTQRTPRIIGKALAKFLVATGTMLKADTALAYGLISSIVTSTNKMSEIAALSVEVNTEDTATSDLREQVFENFDGKITDSLFEYPSFAPYEKLLSRKAPLALQKSMSLIDQGTDLPLERALQLELDSLLEIFSTKDAHAGLSGILKSKPAQFIGE